MTQAYLKKDEKTLVWCRGKSPGVAIQEWNSGPHFASRTSSVVPGKIPNLSTKGKPFAFQVRTLGNNLRSSEALILA